MKETVVETIRFTYKKQPYKFSRKITIPCDGDYNFCEWAQSCYERVGGTKNTVTRKEMTRTGWGVWATYID